MNYRIWSISQRLNSLDQMLCTLIGDLPSLVSLNHFEARESDLEWRQARKTNVSVIVCARSTLMFNVVFRGHFLESHCINISSGELHTITSPGPTTAVYWQPPSIPSSCWITSAGRGFTNIVLFLSERPLFQGSLNPFVRRKIEMASTKRGTQWRLF